MECPNCAAVMKLVPAGVSKSTGKPYNSFFSCPECKHTVNAPIQTSAKPQAPKPNGNGVNPDMMRLAYRKDLMCMIIKVYGPTTDSEAISNVFAELWRIVEG